jgi:hypothetical protein
MRDSKALNWMGGSTREEGGDCAPSCIKNERGASMRGIGSRSVRLGNSSRPRELWLGIDEVESGLWAMRGYSSEEAGYGDVRRPGIPGPESPGSRDGPDLGTGFREAEASEMSGNDSDIGTSGAVWEEEADWGALGKGPN